MALERMSCCGALTHVYSDAGKRTHNEGCEMTLTWTTERLVDECKRWRAYDYTKEEILATLRNPHNPANAHLRLLDTWSQDQIDEAIEIVEQTF